MTYHVLPSNVIVLPVAVAETWLQKWATTTSSGVRAGVGHHADIFLLRFNQIDHLPTSKHLTLFPDLIYALQGRSILGHNKSYR